MGAIISLHLYVEDDDPERLQQICEGLHQTSAEALGLEMAFQDLPDHEEHVRVSACTWFLV